jgi:hypothetical protein
LFGLSQRAAIGALLEVLAQCRIFNVREFIVDRSGKFKQ